MFGLAYVIVPAVFASLQDAIDGALAPFQHGGPERFPFARLAFEDATEALRGLHAAVLDVDLQGGTLTIRGGDPAAAHALDTERLHDALASRGVARWEGRLRDIEPDFCGFARRFCRWPVDPRTGAHGRWRNPLGRWDWWDLGGRFDGVITGARRAGTADQAAITSGASAGRALVGSILDALAEAPLEETAAIEANIELVATLLAAARRGEGHAFPAAVVLPDGFGADDLRWFDRLGLRPIPAGTRTLLGLPPDAGFRETALAAYAACADMAAAAVAFHF